MGGAPIAAAASCYWEEIYSSSTIIEVSICRPQRIRNERPLWRKKRGVSRERLWDRGDGGGNLVVIPRARVSYTRSVRWA